MINNDILSSIFKNYQINKVILVKDNNTCNFIISDMTGCFDLDKWEYLENILKDVTKEKINIMTYNQAKKHLGINYIEKGIIVL